MVGTCLGVTGLSWYSYGVFFHPLSREFGWSQSAISAWFTFAGVGQMVIAPFTGRLADRFGVRPVVLVSIPLFALALASVSLIGNSLWMLYLAALAVGCVGPGTGVLTYSRAVNSWFDAGRGTALGLMASGIGFATIFGPRLLQSIISAWGWRAAFLFLAVTALVALPMMFLFLNERRETGGRISPVPGTGYTLREARGGAVLWIMGMACFLYGLCGGGWVHLVPFLSSNGMSPVEAATYAGMLGITSLLGRIVTGFIIDRLHAPFVCAAVFLAEAVAFAALGLFQMHYALGAIAVIGFALGSEINCIGYCIARYFGLKSYSEIFGLLVVTIGGLGGALGPVAFGFLRDVTDAYGTSYLTSAGFAVGAAALFVVVGRQPFLPTVSSIENPSDSARTAEKTRSCPSP